MTFQFRHPSSDQEVAGYNQWRGGLMVDDVVTSQALAIEGEYNALLQEESRPMNDRILWRLMRLGLMDQGDFHRPMDASSRAMRYAAVMMGRAWTISDRQRDQVSFFISLRLMKTNKNENSSTVWSAPRMTGNFGSRSWSGSYPEWPMR